MKTMLSVIKVDIGSIGGHIRPSQRLLDSHISYRGDDVAIVMFHA